MKPKENKCNINFMCTHSEKKPCVYFKPNQDAEKICDYMGISVNNCCSSVASVNRMVLELKKQGIEIK